MASENTIPPHFKSSCMPQQPPSRSRESTLVPHLTATNTYARFSLVLLHPPPSHYQLTIFASQHFLTVTPVRTLCLRKLLQPRPRAQTCNQTRPCQDWSAIHPTRLLRSRPLTCPLRPRRSIVSRRRRQPKARTACRLSQLVEGLPWPHRLHRSASTTICLTVQSCSP
jgi:hypothetical protein